MPVIANGSVSGVITTDDPGLAAVSRAAITTQGEPAYSAVSGSDGSYSLNAPAGSYVLCVSALGRNPQRLPVTVADGVTLTSNFALRPAGSGCVVNMPAATCWGEPPSAPSAPGDNYPIQFADAGAQPAANTPMISEANRIVMPDESFTISGTRLTVRTGADAGTDTVVWVWARTSSGGGVLRQAKVWRVTESVLTALMPNDIPFGDFLVWVENENGPGAPIVLNKTYAAWVGPFGGNASVGDTKRIFGRNISYNHGTSQSYVYIQPASGGAFIPCAVTLVEPYTVSFTVPGGLANGNYKVYVHNGHGGVYGWADPLPLTIVTPWVRGTTTTSLSPSGGDDTTALQSAINQLTAQPNGGTLLLSAGNFIITTTLHVKNNVEIRGAGMDTTYLLLQLAATVTDGIEMNGQSHCAFTDLTYRDCYGFAQLGTMELDAYSANDTKFTRYKQIADTNTESKSYGQYFLAGNRAEVSNCMFWRGVYLNGTDCWVHDTTMYGDRYWGNGWAGMWCQNDRNIIDYNHFETYNWPVDPKTGSLNYDVNAPETLSKIWCKRLALTYCSDMYFAHSTTKDVAVQDGQGEMILFHGHGCNWWGNVLSNSGCVLTLRTDGTVDGQQVSIDNYNYQKPFYGGGALTPSLVGMRVFIISGRGVGQLRIVLAVNGSTITVDKPWAVQPDSTSVAVINPRAYVDNIVYANDLNALPSGYVQSYTASTGWVIDGEGFSNSFEANVSHRTFTGRSITANSGGPSFWNEARNEQAVAIGGSTAASNDGGGLVIFMVDTNPKGSVLLGNTFRNTLVEVLGTTGGAMTGYGGEGNIFEKITASGKRGIFAYAGGTGWQPAWPSGMTLYRDNIITTIDAPADPPVAQPACIQAQDMSQWLVGNTYTNSTQPYYMVTGSLYSTPVPTQTSLRFKAYAGYVVDDQMVSVVNVGVTGMNWTASASDSWITASISSGNPTGAESAMGRMIVAVDPSGMTVGRHWGSVTVTAGAKTAKVGVCLDVQAGSPPQQPPIASSSAGPLVGTTPLTVSFNAGTSYDPDGSVQSLAWDFGDGSYGSGTTASHTYTTGSYTATLAVTDNAGAVDTARTAVSVSPPMSNLILTGSITGAIATNTPVTLTATSSGGYQPLYKFLINSGNSWTTLRDYQSSGSFTWTPSQSGYYRIKAYVKAGDSTNAYDLVSQELSYPVGILPAAGMALWLKADAGVSKDSNNAVSEWDDQISGSTKKVTQSNPSYQPIWQDAVLNGKPVVHFNGSSCALSSTGSVLTGTSGFTAFTVARYTDTSGNYQYFWWDGTDSPSAGYGPYLSTAGRLRTSWGSSTSQLTLSSGPVKGTWYRMCSRYISGQHEGWLNGTATGSNSASGSNLGTGFAVGNYASTAAYQGLNGDVAEILIYSRNLSEAERQGVESYLSSRWTPPTTTAIDRLKDVKSLGDGVLVSITSAKVATVASGIYSDGSIYVSENDRTAGLKVTGAGTVNLGDNLILTGTTDTDQATGERVLRVTRVTTGANTPLGALGMINKSVTASGQLVDVWGKVTSVGGTYLTLDDGSGSPVKVETDGLATPLSTIPTVGQYVSASGPAGAMAGGVPAVRVRSASDIQVY